MIADYGIPVGGLSSCMSWARTPTAQSPSCSWAAAVGRGNAPVYGIKLVLSRFSAFDMFLQPVRLAAATVWGSSKSSFVGRGRGRTSFIHHSDTPAKSVFPVPCCVSPTEPGRRNFSAALHLRLKPSRRYVSSAENGLSSIRSLGPPPVSRPAPPAAGRPESWYGLCLSSPLSPISAIDISSGLFTR